MSIHHSAYYSVGKVKNGRPQVAGSLQASAFPDTYVVNISLTSMTSISCTTLEHLPKCVQGLGSCCMGNLEFVMIASRGSDD